MITLHTQNVCARMMWPAEIGGDEVHAVHGQGIKDADQLIRFADPCLAKALG